MVKQAAVTRKGTAIILDLICSLLLLVLFLTNGLDFPINKKLNFFCLAQLN